MSENNNNNNDGKDEKDDAVPGCSRDEPPKKFLRLKSFASLMRKDEPEPLLRAPAPDVPPPPSEPSSGENPETETNPDENQSSYNWFVRPSCPLPPLSATTYSLESFYTHDVEYDYWEEEFKPNFLQLESKFKVEPSEEEPRPSSSSAPDNRWGWTDPAQFGPHFQQLSEPHMASHLMTDPMSNQLMPHMSSPYIAESHLSSHLMAGPSHMGSQLMAGPSHLGNQLMAGPSHMGSQLLPGPSHMGSQLMAGPSHVGSHRMTEHMASPSTSGLMTESQMISGHMTESQMTSGHLTESQIMGSVGEDGRSAPPYYWTSS